MSAAFDLDTFFARVGDTVREDGYTVLQVSDPDGDQPDFSYSIGFPVSVDHPEAIVLGLPAELGEFIIRALHVQMTRDGLRLSDGAKVGDLLEGFDCVAREVVDPRMIEAYFCSAIGYHREVHGKTVDRAFQIVWPDAARGLFPWDAGCPQSVIDAQPPLYRTSLNS